KNLKDNYIYREVDRLRVKGKAKPVSVYEILDYHNEHSFKNLKDVIEIYHEGIALYRKAKWKESIARFENALSLNPDDNLTRICIERCEYFLENPPPGDWDGVWTMTEK
ncbi:MAG TPA: adenylate/guanylate cyclase domain-containing protein, partial [Deltaproteobacteria bacterium]|nr:adenylate/guanylate cyclase domain-containing protein [Deltaproteobacteria bacterium]